VRSEPSTSPAPAVDRHADASEALWADVVDQDAVHADDALVDDLIAGRMPWPRRNPQHAPLVALLAAWKADIDRDPW
jgi:hypothetical protein